MDPEYIRELFADFGAVQIRRMFGGAGLYAEGVMFALVTGGLIYLKADADSVSRIAFVFVSGLGHYNPLASVLLEKRRARSRSGRIAPVPKTVGEGINRR